MKTSEKYSLPIFEDTDVADLKKYSEDVATALEKAFEENAYDDTDVKQNISDIQAEQTAQNTSIQQNKTAIANLQAENERLKANQVEGKPDPSDNIYIDDAYSGGTAKMTLLGKSEQETRSGKNLFNIGTKSDNQGLAWATAIEFGDNGSISSDFIAIDNITQIYSNYSFYIYFYDEQKEYLGNSLDLRKESGVNYKNITIPSNENIAYFRLWFRSSNNLSIDMTTITDIMVTKTENELTEYKPYGAMPSPDYPSKIQNIEGDVEIGFVGKNWCGDLLSGLWNNTTKSLGSTTSTIYKSFSASLPKGTYTLSCNTSLSIIRAFTDYDTSANVIFGGNQADITSYIFTITENTTVYISVRRYDNTDWLDTDLLQLESGETVTDYGEHKKQTANFTFTEGQKLMEGGYLASDGVHNVMKQYAFTGNEEVTIFNDLNNEETMWFQIRDVINDAKPIVAISANQLLCNRFETYNCYAASNEKEGICYHSDKRIQIRIKRSRLTTEDVAGFKAYLAEQYANGTPVIVEYELAEPDTTPYTADQQKQWDKLQSLQLFDGVNNISSPATMQLTYVKSTASVINNLQDQINELKQAIL